MFLLIERFPSVCVTLLQHSNGACFLFSLISLKKSIAVFMDDFFFFFCSSFDLCLSNLNIVLKWCVETNLVLNWEKCHFMVTKGIVLGHKISIHGIKVDKARVEVIKKFPSPANVKGIICFFRTC